jgi:hypothetical protein
MKTMTQFERDKESANLRAQILMAREHADRTTGAMKEANLAHMNAAIEALRELNQWRYVPKENEH